MLIQNIKYNSFMPFIVYLTEIVSELLLPSFKEPSRFNLKGQITVISSPASDLTLLSRFDTWWKENLISYLILKALA